MAHIKISNHEMYYAARGESGAPLVFVHGAGDSHLMWNGQLAAFADVARTFALDLPGHGRSQGEGRKTVTEYAAAVREFLEALELERAVIVGSSMGGAIAQVLALDAPEQVGGLVLVGSGARLRVAQQFLDGLQTDFENTARLLVEYYYAMSGAPSGRLSMDAEGKRVVLREKSLHQLLTTGSEVAYGDFAACDAFDVRERVKHISAPTLVVCGRGDRMTPLKYSEFLAQQIPHARLAVMEGAGHMVMLEQPAAFDAVLREWLRTR